MMQDDLELKGKGRKCCWQRVLLFRPPRIPKKNRLPSSSFFGSWAVSLLCHLHLHPLAAAIPTVQLDTACIAELIALLGPLLNKRPPQPNQQTRRDSGWRTRRRRRSKRHAYFWGPVLTVPWLRGKKRVKAAQTRRRTSLGNLGGPTLEPPHGKKGSTLEARFLPHTRHPYTTITTYTNIPTALSHLSLPASPTSSSLFFSAAGNRLGACVRRWPPRRRTTKSRRR